MKMAQFEIIGEITNIEIIAVNHSIRILPILQEQYGQGRWRKLKGQTTPSSYKMVILAKQKYIGLKLTASVKRK
jgi:hypothetical protein